MKKNCDLSNMVFGRLRVVAQAPKGPSNSRYWLCVCECGRSARVTTHHLAHGITRSCGCLHSELVSLRNKTHGDYGSAEHTTWRSMMGRCFDKNNRHYGNYGGRGISVCDHWRNYDNFLLDMGRRPSDKHSIERIDNDKGYSKDNCVWATRTQQNANRRLFKNNTSGHKGVSIYKTKDGNTLYRVSIQRNKLRVFLGSFPSLDDALLARNHA